MKKFLAIVVLGLIWSGSAFGFEREYGGPTSIEEAKEKFFKNRKLDVIEGLWYVEADLAIYAIVKIKEGIYHTWTVEHEVSKYIGSRDKHELTRKSASDKVYIKKTTIYNTANPSEEAVAQGTLILKNHNYYESHYPRGCWTETKCWAPIDSFSIRMWPENINNHNAKFEKQSPGKSKSKNTGASGTAFFITSKGHLITNHHVIDGCSNKSKIIYNKIESPAKLIAKDEILDLALLKADLKKTNHIILSDDPPKKLQRIIAAGYPLGKSLSDDLKFTSGIISSLKGLGDDSTLIQIDAALNKGNSGGPIVDEETGELVGVAVSGLSKAKTEALNFGIKTSSLRNFLESNQIKTPSSTLFSFGGPEVSEILERATVYTYCN